MTTIRKIPREQLATYAPILEKFTVDDTGMYLFTPAEPTYTLEALYGAIGLFVQTDPMGLQLAMRHMTDVFDLTYTPPEGYSIDGVSAFSLKLVDRKVDVTLTYTISKGPEGKPEEVVVDGVIELANVGEHVYLCKLLAGINQGSSALLRSMSFSLTYDGTTLKLVPID